jgi:hypothetical protein
LRARRPGGSAWDIDLTVYGPDGSVAGRSAGSDEDTEPVNVEAAANGTYRVVVDAVTAEGLAYEGRERRPAVEPVRDLLPDLAVRPQRRVTFGPTRVPAGGNPVRNFVNGCLVDEIVEAGARRCLRFASARLTATRGTRRTCISTTTASRCHGCGRRAPCATASAPRRSARATRAASA